MDRLKKFLLTAVFATAASLCAVGPASADIGKVVVLGDSSATGTGLGPDLPGTPDFCNRTEHGFPSRALAVVSHGQVSDRTCNGAVVSSLFAGWEGAPGGPLPRQFDALESDTDVVILAIGDNDAHYGEVTGNCIAHYDEAIRDLDICTQTYVSESGNQLESYAAAIAGPIGGALDTIHLMSPDAEVFLVGYPRIAPPDGVGCKPYYLNLTPGDAPVFAAWENAVNATLETAAATHDAHFVNMQPASNTHNACTERSDRWMNGYGEISPDGIDGDGVHPSGLGAQAVADALVAAFVAAGLDTGPPPNPGPTVTFAPGLDGTVTTQSEIEVNFTSSDTDGVAGCNPVSGTNVELSAGVNTITVTCTDTLGNSGSASATVTRDNTPPTIEISAPADDLNTTAESVTLEYAASDDFGSPVCSPASGVSVALSPGPNTINVSCSDSAGNSESASVTINRGEVPTASIDSPDDGVNTTASEISVAYSVAGEGTISCQIGGDPVSGGSATVALAPGANTITLICSNQFGASDVQSVTVSRGEVPTTSIDSPDDGLNTAASEISVGFSVAGEGTISCTLNGQPAPSSPAAVALAPGANTITLICSNQFGASDVQSVTVSRGEVPTASIDSPDDGVNTTASEISVAYSVAGEGTISCQIGGDPVSGGSATVALTPGANTITLVCSNQFGASDAQSVTVNRGQAPSVAVITPIDGTPTTATAVNVVFTVDGLTSIPVGTTCAVNGDPTSSTETNSVSLIPGTQTIAVTCSNPFGAESASVSLTQGKGPDVAIAAPLPGLRTAAATVNVELAFDSATSIDDVHCKVNGQATSSATVNPVALNPGTNVINVTCNDVFGEDNESLVVYRGAAPNISIVSPSPGLTTTESSLIVSYAVDGTSAIPTGTTCTVNGAPSSDPAGVPVALTAGENTITVTCTNEFASRSQSVVVSRIERLAPEQPLAPGPIGPEQPKPGERPVLKVSLSAVRPGNFAPGRHGGPFSLERTPGAAHFRVRLSAAATVRVRLERLLAGRIASGHCRTATRGESRGRRCTIRRSSSSWQRFGLRAGSTSIFISGRSGSKALPEGRYRVRLIASGSTKAHLGRTFRIKH